jgi:hypothetical protein
MRLVAAVYLSKSLKSTRLYLQVLSVIYLSQIPLIVKIKRLKREKNRVQESGYRSNSQVVK